MRRDFQLIPLIFFVVLVIATSRSGFYTLIITLVILNAILASGYGLLSGWLGLDNLAIGGITLLGGYLTAYLILHIGLNFFVALGCSALVSSLVGISLVYPSLRIKGGYFAITTIIVQLVLTQIYQGWTAFTRGAEGISGIPFPTIPLPGGAIELKGSFLAFLCLFIFAVWLIFANRLITGKTRFKLIAARDDEDLAEHLGINVAYERLKIFFITSLSAGVVGGLFGSLISYLSPNTMSVFFSFNVMVMAYLGGSRSLWGPVIGAGVLTLLPYAFTGTLTLQEFAIGLILILVVVFLPKGIYGIVEMRGKGNHLLQGKGA